MKGHKGMISTHTKYLEQMYLFMMYTVFCLHECLYTRVRCLEKIN